MDYKKVCEGKGKMITEDDKKNWNAQMVRNGVKSPAIEKAIYHYFFGWFEGDLSIMYYHECRDDDSAIAVVFFNKHIYFLRVVNYTGEWKALLDEKVKAEVLTSRWLN